MISSPCFRNRFLTIARNVLAVVLAISMVSGSWWGSRQLAFAEEADTTLSVQASVKPFMDAPKQQA